MSVVGYSSLPIIARISLMEEIVPPAAKCEPQLGKVQQTSGFSPIPIFSISEMQNISSASILNSAQIERPRVAREDIVLCIERVGKSGNSPPHGCP